jgi:HK97 family phage prohead protease
MSDTTIAPRSRRTLRLQHRTLPFEVRTVSEDGAHFEGYAARCHNIDEYGTIMARGCFDRDIAHFREHGFIGGLNHNWNEPIGVPKEIRADNDGLYVSADIVDTRHGEDIKKLMKAKVIRRMSFGFEDISKRWLEGSDQVKDYWRSADYKPTDEDKDRAKHGALLFTRLKVYEASPCMIAGNKAARITSVRELSDANEGYITGDEDEPTRKKPKVRHVVEEDGKWYVKLEKTGKMIPKGGYGSKEEADKLLGDMEAHKHDDGERAGKKPSFKTVQDDDRWYCEVNGNRHPKAGYQTKQEADDLLKDIAGHMEDERDMMPDPLSGDEDRDDRPEYQKAERSRSVLTFEEHTLAVLDAVEEYRDRAQQIAGLRASQGRSLAPERVARLRELQESIGVIVAACQPRANRSDVVRLKRELLLMEVAALAL